jgi:monofunctional biosynthetic peptidoglycan transglycosylase
VLILFEAATIPWFSVNALRTTNPSVTALMRQRLDEAGDHGRRLTIVQRWVPITRLPRHLLNAVVVAEDGTFYTHDGIDWFEVRESIERNIEKGRAARGASTITQQLAKNLYLSTSKDPVRKLKEVAITLLLEYALSKERILELYVNLIEWGPGVFGVEAAAQRYFGKPASALSLEESLRLAAVIPSPLRHRPDSESRYVLRRKEMVRERLFARRWVPGPVPDEEPEEPSRAPDAHASTPADSLLTPGQPWAPSGDQAIERDTVFAPSQEQVPYDQGTVDSLVSPPVAPVPDRGVADITGGNTPP